MIKIKTTNLHIYYLKDEADHAWKYFKKKLVKGRMYVYRLQNFQLTMFKEFAIS